jgi:hypothetical protein
MTPSEAEKIFYEFGDVLSNQWLAKPERFGKHLRQCSRAELRRAILLWVAKQKFEGVDILHRREMPNGQRVAVLELAQNLWPFTSLFGELGNGLPKRRNKTGSAHRDAVSHAHQASLSPRRHDAVPQSHAAAPVRSARQSPVVASLY